MTTRCAVASVTDEHVAEQVPDNAVVVDLWRHIVMPRIHDVHIHLLFSGLKYRYDIGSITPGKLACLIVLDRNLLSQGAKEQTIAR